MAFYSNVFIACTKQAQKKFEAAYKAHNFTPTEIWRNPDGDYLIGWAWVKWYEEFDEVKAIHAVIDELQDSDREEDSFKFIIINENNTFETNSNDCGADIFEGINPTVTLEMGSFESKDKSTDRKDGNNG